MFIVIVVNIFFVFLLLQFIIIPYLIKVGDLPNNTSLNLYKDALSIFSVAKIFSPIVTIPTDTSTSSSLPQDVHTVIYL
jgi:hypothetical protein